MELAYKELKIKSKILERDIDLKIFGKYGFTMLGFPAMSDDFDEKVDLGFVESVQNYIVNGLFRVVFLPTVGNRIWKNADIDWNERSDLHRKYNGFLMDEVFPRLFRIAGSPSPIITFGCGDAGFFAANTYFRHPDILYGTIAIDGYYNLRYLCGFDAWDENCYFNSPMDFLPNLEEQYWLIHLRGKKQVHLIATDRENNVLSIQENKILSNILTQKGIPHNFEIVPPMDSDTVPNWHRIFQNIVSKYF